MRIPRLRREAALVLQFRKHQYSISAIAKFLGRSTSFIHRILKFNETLGFPAINLKRKIPAQIRRLAKQRMEDNLTRYGEAWIAWLLNEDGKPP